MRLGRHSRIVDDSESVFSAKSALSFGLKELSRPNLTYRLGILWVILDPFITAAIYGFLMVVVRGNFRGFSVLLGVLTLQAMNRAISRNIALNIANEPFPLMHTPTRPLLMSRFSTDVTQAAMIGIAGSIIIIPMVEAPISLMFHLTLICMALAFLGVSIGIILSPPAVVVRDIQKFVSYLLLASLFLQAVLYDYEMTSGHHRDVLSFLPHTLGVEWVRHIVSGEPYPFTMLHVAKVSVVWLTLLFVGLMRADRSRWRLTTWV